MLALGIRLQEVGLLVRLPKLRLGARLGVGEGCVRTLLSLGDGCLRDIARLGHDLLGICPGIGDHLVGLGDGRGGQAVGGVLREAEHAGGLECLILGELRTALLDDDGDLGLRLVERDGLGGLHHAGPRRCQFGIEFAHPLAQVCVLLHEPGELGLH